MRWQFYETRWSQQPARVDSLAVNYQLPGMGYEEACQRSLALASSSMKQQSWGERASCLCFTIFILVWTSPASSSSRYRFVIWLPFPSASLHVSPSLSLKWHLFSRSNSPSERKTLFPISTPSGLDSMPLRLYRTARHKAVSV